ncbi:uncharacterized protein LOC135846855 isoform X1 [Planococcus citri]|uniref:uncharacterized protein LOC135846855 isoform X1 n=1 Tax=Planococcus citri TaxID=170843 RepID=UPI0031F7EEB2
MASFNNLPDEIILRIFNYFSQKELQSTLKYVDYRWNRLAEDSSLYREIIADEKLHAKEVAFLLQKHAEEIKCVQFIERDDLNELAEYLSHCCNLQSLMIKLSFGAGDKIVDAIKNCPKLNSIVIQHSSCVRNLPGLFQVIGDLPMKKINIRNTVDDITTENLCHLKNVQDLRLKSIKVDTMGIYKFCQNNCANLTTLKLITYHENIENFTLDVNETIFAAIGSCRNLNTLCLGHQVMIKMNDEGLQKLHNLNNLSTLVIHYAERVSADGFVNFFRQPLAKNLKKIGLYKCACVNSAVIRSIANMCFKLEKFTYEQSKETRERKSNIDPFDIITLSRNCNKLRWFHLFGMDIKIAEVLHLVPTYLPNLESLKYCNDDDPMRIPSFMHGLERKMPDFNVSGLQWKFSLYVHCRKKDKLEQNTLPDPHVRFQLK